MMVLKNIKTLNDRNIALGQLPKYNMPFFTAMEMGKRASKFMKENPQFKDYVELDKKTNGDCSAFFKP